MKKLMICALVIASNAVFATIAFCPESYTCDDSQHCYMSASQPNPDLGSVSYPNKNGTFLFSEAEADYDNNHLLIYLACDYSDNTGSLVMQVTSTDVNNPFKPDSLSTSGWQLQGNNYICDGPNIRNCPFITYDLKNKYKI